MGHTPEGILGQHDKWTRPGYTLFIVITKLADPFSSHNIDPLYPLLIRILYINVRHARVQASWMSK